MLGKAPQPIAIVGMACRFAGDIDSLEGFWQLLREGRDTIGDLPPGRWDWYASRSPADAAAMRGVTRRGAFLSDIKGFDADFFDITPREAALIDPQQRIVLELAWEALEHAGIPPHRLAGSDAGVFVGVGADDYGRRLLEDLPAIEAWTGIGGAYCAVANRVSYLLDLRGPSMAVDTACSSSLVAIHLAVQALRAGECPVALAGGVLVMAAPGLSLVLGAAGATALDGRCKSFDADADGYGRGEGGGIVVLKRLADARRDGDRVLAVIRGSAVHQDGRTNGIMAPSGPAQAHLLRSAYAAAGIAPSTVDYVEAHGTGTRAGDPVEAAALAEVFGRGREPGRPLWIGSVKPNVGHLEAGAGVAGVVKTVLALRHGEIPPSLNVTTPNPAIPWDTNGLRVVTERMPWPASAIRRAGVSAYGYGGTVAHVIIERSGEPEPEPEPMSYPDRPGLYPLSGANDLAVSRYALRLADRLSQDAPLGLADVGHTLARRRSHLKSRAAIYAADRGQLIDRLREFAADGTGAASGRVLPGANRGIVWVFSGHGSQWNGMARQLLAADPVFAAAIDRLTPVFQAELGWSPRHLTNVDGPHPVDVVQPMLFAVQVGLSAVWRAAGVRPAAVLGHSVGEIAAAVAAGVLRLEDGARLVCRRSALLRQVAGKGAMVMVNLSRQQAERELGGRTDVAIAVSASPGSTVISGDVTAIQELAEHWQAAGLMARLVDSDVAFHSPHMDPITDALAAFADGLSPAAPKLPVYGTALPDPRSAAPRDGAYWAANLRRPVRFAEAVTAAAEDGYRFFLEISPHPVVEHSIGETLESLGVDDSYVGHSLRRHQPERETLYLNLGRLHCHGAEVDWAAMWPQGSLIDLPTTVWQRRPHWAPEPAPAAGGAQHHDPASHTLLGRPMSVPGAGSIQTWQTVLDERSRPYPGGHRVLGTETVPAAVVVHTLLAAASPAGLAEVVLRVPVSVTHRRELQVVRRDGALTLASRLIGDPGDNPGDDLGWVTHATAVIRPNPDPHPSLTDPAAVRLEPLAETFIVDRLAALGVVGMGFPWTVEWIEQGDNVLRAAIGGGPSQTWASLLDAALSAASVALPGPPVLRMPNRVQSVSLDATPPASAIVSVEVTAADTVEVTITGADGRPCGRLAGLGYGVLEPADAAASGPRALVHRVEWRPAPRHEGARPPSRVALVGPAGAARDTLAEHLAHNGFEVRAYEGPEELPERLLGGDTAIVVVPAAEDTAVAGTWLLTQAAQRLAGAAEARSARLWCVTRGVADAADPAALGQAALWGLGRVIGGEHPEFWGGTVDLGPSAMDVNGLVEVLGGVRGEDVVSVRDGSLTVPRLHRVAGEPVRPAIGCRPDATYLITGGLGALGLEVAQWLAHRGMRRVVLAGRGGLPPRGRWDSLTDPATLSRVAAVVSLERLGVTVVPLGVDAADGAELHERLSALGLPPIRGVVHAAGVLDNRAVRAVDEESLRRVLRPKIAGALALHGLFPPGSVDFFVLFSSCGQLLGLPGQASYAAGNSFLDALALHRRRAGDAAAISLGWTSWRGLGMSVSSKVTDAELAARGVADVGRSEALQAWEFAVSHDLAYAAVLRTLPHEPGERRMPVLSELAELKRPKDSAGQAAAWAQLSGPDLFAFLAGDVGRMVAAETGLPAGEIDARRPLVEVGVDSVMTVRLRRSLERTYGVPVPATLLWDRPTVKAIAEWLFERIEGSAR